MKAMSSPKRRLEKYVPECVAAIEEVSVLGAHCYGLDVDPLSCLEARERSEVPIQRRHVTHMRGGAAIGGDEQPGLARPALAARAQYEVPDDTRPGDGGHRFIVRLQALGDAAVRLYRTVVQQAAIDEPEFPVQGEQVG